MSNSVLPPRVLIVCAAVLGGMSFHSASAQAVSTDTTIGTVVRQDSTLQSDLQRLERIEKVQAELQSEIAAIRQRMAERTGETAPHVAHAPESTTPPPPAEMSSSKSSIDNSKVARLPELVPVEEEHWRFFVGGELLYVQPRWSTNPAFAESTVSRPSFARSTSQTNFDHDFNASPVITAGIVAPNGLGLRGRYWSLDSDASAHAATTGDSLFPPSEEINTASPLGLGLIASSAQLNTDHNLAFRNSLRMQAADAELTWTHTAGQATILLSGGARYANIRQGYDVDDTGAFTIQSMTFPFRSRVRSSHRFEGFGPTLSGDLTYPLGFGGLSLYADGRVSIIFGEDREKAVMFTDHRELSQNVAMSIAELAGGVGWSHSFNRFGVELRAGVVGQMWFNTGNGANNENIIGLPPVFFAPGNQTVDPNANLGLIGFQFSSGIHF